MHDESGALVLSEFTDAADELGSAFLVNPHDIEGLKDAIARAATISPAEARRQLTAMTAWLTGQDDPDQAAQAIRRFGDPIRATPSLQAHQSDMMDQFVVVATEILAARGGMNADDPEPQIAARALLGLWHVQGESLRKHLSGAPAQVHEMVTADVRCAARLIGKGLRAFAARRIA